MVVRIRLGKCRDTACLASLARYSHDWLAQMVSSGGQAVDISIDFRRLRQTYCHNREEVGQNAEREAPIAESRHLPRAIEATITDT